MGSGKMRVAVRCIPFAILLATIAALVYFSWEPPAAPKPAEITWRSPLPSCGDAAPRPRAEPQEPLTPSVIGCLSDGRERDSGEFAFTLYTTEGDPIVYHLRTVPGTNDVEVLVDSSQDQFGGGPAGAESPAQSPNSRLTCSATAWRATESRHSLISAPSALLRTEVLIQGGASDAEDLGDLSLGHAVLAHPAGLLDPTVGHLPGAAADLAPGTGRGEAGVGAFTNEVPLDYVDRSSCDVVLATRRWSY